MLPGKEILIDMKRIEIVVARESLNELVDLLREAEIRGYTVIKKAGGLGSRGERDPEDYPLEEENAVMVIACEEELAERLIMLLHPRLKDLGGMCLVSDCRWVKGPPVSY
ncbi:MAG: transcriptional regulator [Nitrosospira sp.]